MLATQLAVVAQSRPQPPQCSRSLVMLVSQPSAASPLQSAKPEGHVVVHRPPTQLCPTAHATPHAPQCAALVLVSLSQPLASLPSQLAKVPRHMPSLHAPATQVGMALANEHTVPHAPQCCVSERGSTQDPAHNWLGATHVVIATQRPMALLHTGVAPLHASPQRAQ